MPAGDGRLASEAVGEIDKEDGGLIIRPIHVTCHMQIDPGKRGVGERVHGVHADRCPVAPTISNCPSISTSLTKEGTVA